MKQQAFQGWQGKLGHIVALLAGGLLPFAFAPFHFQPLAIVSFYPLAVISLILLFLSWHGVDGKIAAKRGFLFGLGLFGIGVSWVYVAIHDFGHTSMLLAGLLTFGFVSFFASYLALMGWIVKYYTKPTFTSFDFILLLPVVWFGFELFKGWFLTGFPWLELGVSQIDGPLAGYLPVIGVHGVSLLVALTAGLLINFWQSRHSVWALSAIFIWTVGYQLQQEKWTQKIGESIKVSMIQGNVPQSTKWDRDQLFKTLALYQARTEQNWNSDLIIWPENAITVFYHQAKEYFLDPLTELASQNETQVLVGLPVLETGTKDYYNSMMLLGEAEAFYHKRHLVPFGDYLPIDWLRGLIGFFDLPMSAFVPGEMDQNLIEVAGLKLGISICYEDVFSDEVLQTLPEAEILVNATNNAWYGDSLAPHQHLQISRSRALEMGRPVLRVTTNGISAFIDHRGNIIQQSPQFTEVVLTADVQGRQGKTPYVIGQRWPLWGLALFMMVLWAYYRSKNLKNS